jgi:hypothetical protein
MKLDRAIRLEREGVARMRSIYSMAKMFGYPSRIMEENRIVSLRDLCGKTKPPHWLKEYWNGYWRAIIDRAYETDLVYGGYVNGVFMSTHSNRPDYYGKNDRMSAKEWHDRSHNRGHYWATCINKPFFCGIGD